MRRVMMSNFAFLSFILALSAVLTSCATRAPTVTLTPSRAPPASAPAPSASPSPIASQPAPTSLPTLAPKLTPADTLAPVVLTCPEIEYDQVHFTCHGLATSVEAETEPAALDGPDCSYAERHPAYAEFRLSGYPRQKETLHRPQVYVFPVAEYEAMDACARQAIQALKTLLGERPSLPIGAPQPYECLGCGNLPFLPPPAAGQVFLAKVQYLDFENGSGVRFLTQLSQDYDLINNHKLFYTFQGLTSDRQYYVSVILPVAAPILPDNYPIDPLEYVRWYKFSLKDYPVGSEAFVPKHMAYVKETTQQLDALDASSYTPDLDTLDAFIRSLRVK